MRCSNCGWDNPDSNTSCSKCHKVLSSGPMSPGVPAVHKMTVFECRKEEENGDNPGNCPECGYPLTVHTDVCPWCGFSAVDGKEVFRLVPMDGEGNDIVMTPGQTVVICGHKFRFEK